MAKVTQGYVWFTADGQPLYVGTRSTHTGTHTEMQIASSPDYATVSPYPRLNREEEFEMTRQFPGAVPVPVEVTREVKIIAYGVRK